MVLDLGGIHNPAMSNGWTGGQHSLEKDVR
jgi:hypothetical protein